MNYPIYNFDYEYQLEEIVRYLKFFDKHIVHISTPINFRQTGIIHSHHQFREDGLIIRLYWKSNGKAMSSKFITMKELLELNREKYINLQGYDFIRYSDNRPSKQQLPSKECKEVYFNKVMKNRKKTPYNEEEYQLIEYSVRRKGKIPDVFFDILLQEVSNTIAFEKYYQEIKKQSKEKEGTT